MQGLDEFQLNMLQAVVEDSKRHAVASDADQRNNLISEMNAEGLRVESKYLGNGKWLVFGFEPDQDKSKTAFNANGWVSYR
jgi:hypothetical protein